MGRLLWLAALLSVAALACSAPAQGPAGAGSGTDAPKAGGVLHARVPGDPASWDLSLFKTMPAWEGHTLAYNSLLAFKSGPDVQWDYHEVVPELAERWEVSPDARTFTFHLRKGVRFADLPPVNGRELTSADVKWSFEYASRTGQFANTKLAQGNYDWMFEGLQGIDTPDPYTAVVRFQEPFIPFISYAASDSNPVVPHEIYDRDGNMENVIVGSGPFQLDPAAGQPGSRWVWKKNANFYEPGRPYLDEVEWRVVKDDSAAYAAFKAKQLDVLGNSSLPLNVADAEQMRKEVPDAVFMQHVAQTPWHLFMNTRQGPLADQRIRRAISEGIDRDAFIKVLTAGKGRLGIATPDTFTEEEARQLLRYDPDNAQRLVAQAGYPGGVELEMTYPGNEYGEDYITGIQLLQAQLSKVGITLNLKSIDKVSYSSRRKNGNYVMNAQQGSAMESDLDSLLYAGFHSSSKKNYAGTNVPDLDERLAAQRREADPARRRQLLRDLVREIYADKFYDIVIHYDVETEVWQPYVKGFAFHMETRGMYPAGTWLDR